MADDATMQDAIRWMWSLGDYGALAVHLEPHAIELAQRSRLQAGSEVLDVAAGNGNFAIAAARLGATVVATDLTPTMVDLGRSRSGALGLAIEWREADAEQLPFPDERFDVVASVFGAMFAPHPDRVASELFRVAKRGGLVAMATTGRRGSSGVHGNAGRTGSGATAPGCSRHSSGGHRRGAPAFQGAHLVDRDLSTGADLRVRVTRRRLGVLGAREPADDGDVEHARRRAGCNAP